MENNTTDPCGNRECEGCIADPALLSEFKQAIHALSGKWKLEILGTLMDGGVRFGALRRALAPITQHMLTAQLRELEHDGLVSRKVLAEKPLQVEYELTDSAWGLLPAFRELLAWSKTFGPRRTAVAGGTQLGAGIS
ncbi:transcriptional regulator [Bradyrhizobium sp. LTSP885]|uniref:winged helix-turn-helix transcriptional regulator n=1 Tax=Bradyrhizobium sp. LTSP885 TaxID=1619232 RepID=UPI0005C89D2F|nr:helix-turn-helix domain-containing protein [Bradyrhizobium sp. LTSP885]KJC37154.1 transcriptional regulator [Bradyrhizobium sp. LTSP885]